MNKLEKAYIAGIVDGEGNISLTKYRHPGGKTGFCMFPTIQIANTNLEFMLEINEIIKGGFYISKRVRLSNHKNKIIIYFKGKNKVFNFLREIYPYLRIKKKQAEIVMNYCKRRMNLINEYSKRDFKDQEIMKKLNQRGLQIN